MPQNLLVVVGAGALPELPMSAACHDLASALDAVLVQEGCGQPPHPLLQTLTNSSAESERSRCCGSVVTRLSMNRVRAAGWMHSRPGVVQC